MKGFINEAQIYNYLNLSTFEVKGYGDKFICGTSVDKLILVAICCQLLSVGLINVQLTNNQFYFFNPYFLYLYIISLNFLLVSFQRSVPHILSLV
jgi:hypothetical protein